MKVSDIDAAIVRIAQALETEGARLCELDAILGDGDLGTTLQKAFRHLDKCRATLPDDVGDALGMCAREVNRVAGSTFGTLFSVGLRAAARRVPAERATEWLDVADMLAAAGADMAARGRAKLGDKTVLDALAAAQQAAVETTDASMLTAMIGSVDAAIEHFRHQSARVGRARIHAERSIGVPDAGMVAVAVMLKALQRHD